MTESLSIHPRVVKGVTIRAKSNTCAPRKGESKKIDRKARRLNIRQLACNNTRAEMRRSNAKFNPLSFRMPGSMNQHKR